MFAIFSKKVFKNAFSKYPVSQNACYFFIPNSHSILTKYDINVPMVENEMRSPLTAI